MSYLSYKHELIRDATKKRVPILGEFELTARCNLNCEMCYVVDQKAKDLDTETWITIFKQAVDAGLVFALLTGGEFFIRKDAIKLYNTLYDLGVKITVYTNGTDITKPIIDALKKRPPEKLAITLYGASNETYQIITKHKNGFNLVKSSIAQLQAININLILRTIPLKALYHDLDNMIAFAKSNNLVLNYLRYVGPTRKGCTHALSMRLSPSDLIDFEARIHKAFDFKSVPTFSITTKNKACAAFKSAYFINYEGMMQPCAMAYKPAKSIINEDFSQVFKQLSQQFELIEHYDGCHSCAYKNECMQCYARRLLEKNAQSCPIYLKTYARLRKGVISDVNL